MLPPSPMDDQIRRGARFRERCRSIMCRVQRLFYGLCFWKHPFVPGELFRTSGNFARWSFHFREHVWFQYVFGSERRESGFNKRSERLWIYTGTKIFSPFFPSRCSLYK